MCMEVLTGLNSHPPSPSTLGYGQTPQCNAGRSQIIVQHRIECEMQQLQLLHIVFVQAFLSLFSVTALKSPASELLPHATKLISEKWQKSWNNCTGNKLQSVNPSVGVARQIFIAS